MSKIVKHRKGREAHKIGQELESGSLSLQGGAVIGNMQGHYVQVEMEVEGALTDDVEARIEDPLAKSAT